MHLHYVFIEKNLCENGAMQFKPVLFQGRQLYLLP